MREERGITLISLITYIIVLLVVISAITLASNFFINNMNEAQQDSKNISEINKFDVAFLSDIKKEGVSILWVNEDKNAIVLKDEHDNNIQYSYENKNIYRVKNEAEKIKINDEKIDEFEVTEWDNSSLTIKIKVNEITKNYKLGKY